MNREEAERIGHLLKQPEILISKDRKYRSHRLYQSNAIFLGHAIGYGDLYWVSIGTNSGKVICRESNDRYSYLELAQPEYFGGNAKRQLFRYRQQYPWYSYGLRLARKRRLYNGIAR